MPGAREEWEGGRKEREEDSKEIVGSPSGDMGFTSSGSGVELQERVLQFVVQLDHSCLIAATIAVVRRREHGHHIAVVTPVVALHDELMRPGYEGESVGVVERLGDVLAESVARSTGGDAPAATVIGVRPQQVAHGSLVRDFLNAVESPDVVEGVYRGGQAAVQAEDLTVHKGCQWEIIKQVGEVFPHIRVAIFAQTLVIEPVDLGDLAGFVVSSQNRDTVLETDLEADQQAHGLDGVVASIDIVSHEQVVGVWGLSAHLEKLHQIVELSMHVTAHRHGAFHFLHIRLLLQNLFRLFTEDFDLVLGELLAVVELLDPRVHVHDEVLVQELA